MDILFMLEVVINARIKYIDKLISIDNIITGEINLDQIEDFKKFAKEVQSLEYLNKLYTLLHSDDDVKYSNMIDDNSEFKVYNNGNVITSVKIFDTEEEVTNRVKNILGEQ